MRVTLQATEGPHKGQTFTFQGHDTFLVGRSRRALHKDPEDRFPDVRAFRMALKTFLR